MNEYVGCKVDCEKYAREIKITQPVLFQSYQDEYDIENKKSSTGGGRTVMIKGDEENKVDAKDFRRKRIRQYDMKYKYKRTFENIFEAEEISKINRKHIEQI